MAVSVASCAQMGRRTPLPGTLLLHEPESQGPDPPAQPKKWNSGFCCPLSGAHTHVRSVLVEMANCVAPARYTYFLRTRGRTQRKSRNTRYALVRSIADTVSSWPDQHCSLSAMRMEECKATRQSSPAKLPLRTGRPTNEAHPNGRNTRGPLSDRSSNYLAENSPALPTQLARGTSPGVLCLTSLSPKRLFESARYALGSSVAASDLSIVASGAPQFTRSVHFVVNSRTVRQMATSAVRRLQTGPSAMPGMTLPCGISLSDPEMPVYMGKHLCHKTGSLHCLTSSPTRLSRHSSWTAPYGTLTSCVTENRP